MLDKACWDANGNEIMLVGLITDLPNIIPGCTSLQDGVIDVLIYFGLLLYLLLFLLLKILMMMILRALGMVLMIVLDLGCLLFLLDVLLLDLLDGLGIALFIELLLLLRRGKLLGLFMVGLV